MFYSVQGVVHAIVFALRIFHLFNFIIMKPMIFCLFFLGSTASLLAQEYCQYCFILQPTVSGDVLNITNVYTLKKGYYSETRGFTREVCSQTRETAELKRKQEIESAQQSGIRINYQTHIGQDCDEAYERSIADQKRREQENLERARQMEAQRKLEEERQRQAQAAAEEAERKRQLELEKQEVAVRDERNKALAIQKTRQLYQSKGPKPEQIADGWHRVLVIENEDRLYSCLVLVEDNRVIQLADSLDPLHYQMQMVFSGPITDGATLLKIENRYLDLYFMRYLDRPDERTPPPSTGSLIFWTDSELAGNITISLVGQQIGLLTQASSSGQPVCMDSLGLTITDIRSGTYSYLAKSEIGNLHWQGEITIYPGECSQEHLEVSLGKAFFGTQQSTYLPLRLTIKDETGKTVLTHSIQNEPSEATRNGDCQLDGGVQLVTDAGMYSYTLESQNSATKWMKSSGNFNIAPRSCEQWLLTMPEANFRLELPEYPYAYPVQLYLDGQKIASSTQTNGIHVFEGIFRPDTLSYYVWDPQIKTRISEGQIKLVEGNNDPIFLSPKPITGKAIFFISYPKVRREPIQIFVDGREVGSLLGHYSYPKVPEKFGEPQSVSVELQVGRHLVSCASPGKWKWEAEIDIKFNKVNIYELKRAGSTYYLQLQN